MTEKEQQLQSLESELRNLNEEINCQLRKREDLESKIKSIQTELLSSADSNTSDEDYIKEHFQLTEKILGYTIEKYIGFEEEKIVIPNHFNKKPIISIGRRAFSRLSFIKQVILGDNIISIDDFAFSFCTSLEDIRFPESLIYIGKYSFSNCTSLKKLVLSNAIRFIGERCFEDSGVTDVVLPNSIKDIKSYVFSGTKIEAISIPYGVETIEIKAFYCCEQLKKVDLPFSLKKIGEAAFLDCPNIKEIDIPSSVSEIGSYNFKYTYIVQPDKLYNPKYYTNSCNTTILCRAGSFAQEYARNHGFKFQKSEKTYKTYDTTPKTKLYLYAHGDYFDIASLDNGNPGIFLDSAIKQYSENIVYYNDEMCIMNFRANIQPKDKTYRFDIDKFRKIFPLIGEI